MCQIGKPKDTSLVQRHIGASFGRKGLEEFLFTLLFSLGARMTWKELEDDSSPFS